MYYFGFFLKEIIDILVTENLPTEGRIKGKAGRFRSFSEGRWVGMGSLSLRINKNKYIIFYLPLSGKFSL